MRARAPPAWASGLAAVNRLSWRKLWSIAHGWNASCGRNAAFAPLSANSTRAGDSSSTSWKSVSCAK